MKWAAVRSKEMEKLLEKYAVSLSKKDLVQQGTVEGFTLVSINKQPAFFYYQNRLIPMLNYLQNFPLLKKVVIDQGAIKFIVNGADVMRPGIVSIEEGIQKDEAIMVIDVVHQKPLAVGIALYGSEEMKAMTKGKVIKNIHYVGDEIWKMCKES